jgi:hypothetical protein
MGRARGANPPEFQFNFLHCSVRDLHLPVWRGAFCPIRLIGGWQEKSAARRFEDSGDNFAGAKLVHSDSRRRRNSFWLIRAICAGGDSPDELADTPKRADDLVKMIAPTEERRRTWVEGLTPTFNCLPFC